MLQLKTQDIQILLKEKGLKATMQRIATLKALLQTGHHPTAEELHSLITIDSPSISLGTIYKTLDTLVDNGLANRVSTKDGYMRYDGNLNAHNHILCTNTNEIIDYEDHELNEILTAYFKKKNIKNLKIKDIQVQINGFKEDPKKGIKIL